MIEAFFNVMFANWFPLLVAYSLAAVIDVAAWYIRG